MATPTTNAVDTTTFNPSATGLGRFLADGEKWGGALGTAATLTYSFTNADSFFAADYGDEAAQLGDPFSAGEQAAAAAALAVWAAVANLRFVRVADNESTVGEIRFSKSLSIEADTYAFAYLPSSDPSAGDVWANPQLFNPDNTPTIAKGSNDFETLVHELGHALGLKHSFDAPTVPAGKDNLFFTVMSYTASPWSVKDDDVASFYPTTPMFYDLIAIQAMYGRNMNHNKGNTTYTFLDGKKYFQTIDDASGVDTIRYVGADNVSINLNIGAFSSLSESITFTSKSTRATVAIGPNTLIENATGGNGNDTLTGNALNNTLNGGRGNDTLNGGGGHDKLFGSFGNDRMNGGAGRDAFYFNTALSSTNVDTISGFNVRDDSIFVENAIFKKLAATGVLNADFFHTGASAADGNDFMVYNQATGALSYDADGSGRGEAIRFASVSAGLVLTNADIVVF